jgi:hypothetical protein
MKTTAKQGEKFAKRMRYAGSWQHFQTRNFVRE